MIRTLLGTLVAVLVILIVVGIWLPDRVTASYAGTVDIRSDRLYSVVNDLEALPAWSPWDGGADADNYTFSSPATGEGAWAAWSSEDPQSGSGDIRIVETRADGSLQLAVSFDEAGSGEWWIVLEPEATGTRVTFRYASSLSEAAGPVYGLLLRYGRGLVQRSIEEALARGLRDLEKGFDDGSWNANDPGV